MREKKLTPQECVREQENGRDQETKGLRVWKLGLMGRNL